MNERHAAGAGLGLLGGGGCFVAGGGIVYAIVVVAGSGKLLGHPWPLFDRASRTDFGPGLTWFGWAVYLLLWFLPFVVGGAVVADGLGERGRTERTRR